MSSERTFRWKRGLAEFIVIFAGVSLSLIADEWRDERREGRERAAVFQQLAEDIREDLTEHAFIGGRASDLLESASWFLDEWGGPAPNSGSTAGSFAVFTCPLIFEYRSPGYAGLKSASGLPLISGTDLGRRVIEYFEVRQVEVENFAQSLSASRDRLVESLYPYVEFGVCRVGESTAGASLLVPWAELSNNPELRNRLAELVTHSALTIEWVDRAVASAEALVAELEG